MDINIEYIGIITITLIALAGLFANILQRLSRLETCIDPDDGERLTRLETKLDLMLQWVEILNGDITNNKKFLKKLKMVTQKKYDNKTKKEL
jgi:uncharacterized coiled-coil protein SlyX